MGRWSDRESDAEHLPEGFTRVGYDADTQIYTFRDANGKYWEGEEGNRYGNLWPVGQRPRPTPAETEAQESAIHASNREAVRMMLPFALLVLVLLFVLFKFINSGPSTNTGLD